MRVRKSARDFSKIAKFVGVPLAFFLLLEIAHTGCFTRPLARRSPTARARLEAGHGHARAFDAAFPAVSVPV